MLKNNLASRLARASAFVLLLAPGLQTTPAFSEPLRGNTGNPEADFNWGLSAINAHKVHEAGYTGRGVRIGVTDTGIDLDHSEFAGRVGGSYNPFTDRVPAGPDLEGHGTSVASVIGAKRDGKGMMGIAYNSPLYSAKLDRGPRDPNIPMPIVYRRIYDYYMRNAVGIVNNSWGLLDEESEQERRGLYDAVAGFSAAGGVSVFATGNNWTEVKDRPSLAAAFPMIYPELEDAWLAVTALGPNDERALYAQICGPAAQWCLAAPGGQIATDENGEDFLAVGMELAIPDGGYEETAGTSFAAPLVTGGLAVTREIFPDADMRDLRKLILHTAIDIGDPGVDAVFGWGKLDLGNVVDTISPYGRSIFAAAAYNRQLSMEQVGSLPFGPLVRSKRLRALWAAGDLASADVKASGALPQSRARSRALAAGIDLLVREGLTAGLGLAYTNGITSEKGTANTAKANGFHGFGYADWSSGDWYARGTLGLGYFRQTHERRTIPGLAGTVLALGNPQADSRSSGFGVYTNAEAGKVFDLGPADLSLFGHLSGTTHKMKGFSESGLELLGYDVAGERFSTAMVGPGLRLSRAFTRGSWTVTPEVELSYGRVIGDTDFAVGTSLLGRSMEARTAALGRNVFGVGARLNFELPQKGLTASVSYKGSFRKNANQNSVQLSLSLAF